MTIVLTKTDTTQNLVQSVFRNNDYQLFKFNIEGDVYKIISKTKKCLDVEKESEADKGNIVLQDCADNDQSQEFTLKKVDSFYQIISIHSDKCLDVDQGSEADGANIQQYECPGKQNYKDNQLWEFIEQQ